VNFRLVGVITACVCEITSVWCTRGVAAKNAPPLGKRQDGWSSLIEEQRMIDLGDRLTRNVCRGSDSAFPTRINARRTTSSTRLPGSHRLQLILAATVLLWPVLALAQEPDDQSTAVPTNTSANSPVEEGPKETKEIEAGATTTEPPNSLTDDAADPTPTLSGFSAGAGLETGDSVTADLAADDVDVGGVLTFPRVKNFFEPWYGWKRRLNENHGLKLQFTYQGLHQEAPDSPGETGAAAGRGQIQGSWTLVGRGSKNPGMLTFRIENRHAYGLKIPPSQLGAQFGSINQTGTGFSDFGGAVTEVAWRQALLNGRMKFVLGKISATSWYNGFALSSSMRGFQNSGLQTSGSHPLPGRGIGGGAAVRIGERWVALAGMHDANSRAPDNPFDTIGEGEFYYSTEFRYYPTTWANRIWDQVRFHVWYQDERTDAGLPSGYGATFLASRFFDNNWGAWVLGGVSDGDATSLDADLIAGVGYGFNTVHRAARDVLAVALGWGRPSDKSLQDQWTSELFYRFQLVQSFALTPSVQYIINPASSPDESNYWVFSFRARLTF
jgi:porin